jgi:hypothetical protein
MAMQSKPRKSSVRAKHGRVSKQVIDRRGRPAPRVTAKDLRARSGEVLRMARRRGAVEISRGGKAVAVALAPDLFVDLCVAYAIRSIASAD